MKQSISCSVFGFVIFACAAVGSAAPRQVQVTVGADKREAVVYAPANAKSVTAPVVFAFHGHGGSAQGAAKQFDFQKHWPEAIVVYMQGLPIVSNTDPDGKKAGWQHEAGELEDRDLKFFDAVLTRLKSDYKVDENRICATGHSNGGGFTYLLWASRGDVFAAFAPSAASSANRYVKELKPKPALHVAGKADTTAPYEKQAKLMESIRALNGCSDKGKPLSKYATLYPSAGGTPFIEYVHPGGHELPDDAIAQIVKFFKLHAKNATP